jgi:hypothetical protein
VVARIATRSDRAQLTEKKKRKERWIATPRVPALYAARADRVQRSPDPIADLKKKKTRGGGGRSHKGRGRLVPGGRLARSIPGIARPDRCSLLSHVGWPNLAQACFASWPRPGDRASLVFALLRRLSAPRRPRACIFVCIHQGDYSVYLEQISFAIFSA